MEKNYDFRKRLLEVHRRDRRDLSLDPAPDELALDDNSDIVIPTDAGRVLVRAGIDYNDAPAGDDDAAALQNGLATAPRGIVSVRSRRLHFLHISLDLSFLVCRQEASWKRSGPPSTRKSDD